MKKNNMVVITFRIPAELNATLRERMRVTLMSPSATVAALLEEGMWMDVSRLMRMIPQGETVQLSLRLPAALVSRVRERMAWTGRSQNAEMVFLLASALEHEADDERLERVQMGAAK